jgi:hypothetical protein
MFTAESSLSHFMLAGLTHGAPPLAWLIVLEIRKNTVSRVENTLLKNQI